VTPALRVRGLHKSYDVPVLRGLDLDVPAGSLVALLGPSGCGKTTLLRCVAGFERASSGTVEVAGQDVTGLPPERRRVGVVPQEGALFPHLSVAGNVGFGLPRSQRRGARVEEVLALVGLETLAGRMPHELSGGQQQRVAVARALAPSPALVLLDEPFSALDAGLRAAVRAEVRACLRAAGASAVLVTHDQQEALSVADVVAVVRDGRVVQAAGPWEVYSRPADLGVATFVGEAVVLKGSAHDGSADSPLGPLAVEDASLAGPVSLVVRPEQLEVEPLDLPVVDALVVDRVFYGHDALLRLQLPGGATATARTPGHPLPAAGSTVKVGVRGPVVAFPR
jgi:iron(III) transport system ATP-binding protein